MQQPAAGPPRSKTGGWIALAASAFALSAAVRAPYLSESFWLDELHSAWTVWGELGEVSGRAAWGNQTPVYFWGLWFWRQLFGDGEVALRVSSVLLSSLAGGMLAVGVARQSRSWLGGVAAGGMLALEPNAIFFGTELRVFAAVMLLASIACWCAAAAQRPAGRGARLRLLAVVGLATLIQPTSLGVLGWLFVSGMIAQSPRRWRSPSLPQRHRSLLAVAALLLVTLGGWLCWTLAGRVLLAAWQHRGQWASFASADSPWQLWTLWNWPMLLLIPAGLALALARWDRLRTASERDCAAPPSEPATWVQPALVAVVASGFFWLLSAAGIAAVFHRRYMIAALPILVWAGASAIGEIDQRLRRSRRGDADATTCWRRRAAALLWTVLVLSVLAVAGVQRLSRANQLPRLRGEGWREAVAYVAAVRDAGVPVLLSPGLIEAPRLLREGDAAALNYLAYPLCGPYNLQPVLVTDLAVEPSVVHRQRAGDGTPRIAVLRGSRAAVTRWAQRVTAASGDSDSGKPPFTLRSFGGVQVVQFTAAGALALKGCPLSAAPCNASLFRRLVPRAVDG